MKVKSSQVSLLNYADDWISSVDLGVIKEDQKFWTIAFNQLNVLASESIFFDDNISIVNSAIDYGIKYSVHITEPTNNDSVIYESKSDYQIRKLVDLIRAD